MKGEVAENEKNKMKVEKQKLRTWTTNIYQEIKEGTKDANQDPSHSTNHKASWLHKTRSAY